MFTKSSREKANAASKIRAVEKKRRSREEYYKNPNICLNCGNVIQIREKERACDARSKKFCNSKCSAIYNNSKYPKRVMAAGSKTGLGTGKCVSCGVDIQYIKLNGRSFSYRKYCESCLLAQRKKNAILGIESRIGGPVIDSSTMTKGELYKKYGKTESSRTAITRRARIAFLNSDKPKSCICGYNKHIDVCHIIGIASFPDTATIDEINSLDNLIGLCKNHHWEFDHGIMEESMRVKIQQIA